MCHPAGPCVSKRSSRLPCCALGKWGTDSDSWCLLQVALQGYSYAQANLAFMLSHGHGYARGDRYAAPLRVLHVAAIACRSSLRSQQMASSALDVSVGLELSA